VGEGGETDGTLIDAFGAQRPAQVEKLYVNSKYAKLSPPNPIDLIMTGGNLDVAKIAAFGEGYDYVIVDLENLGFCGVTLTALAYERFLNKANQQVNQPVNQQLNQQVNQQ
jgi:hypothetical protein